MELSNLLSENFVVLPGNWSGSRARDLIWQNPSITHAIVAEQSLATLRPGGSKQIQPGEKRSGNVVLEIPQTSIGMLGRRWDMLQISPQRRLYVTHRDELAELDEEESEQILGNLIQLRDWRTAPLISVATDPAFAPDLGVVFDQTRLAGIFDLLKPTHAVRIAGLRLDVGQTKVIISPIGGGGPPDKIPPSTNGGDQPPADNFNAYPRLDAPDQLALEQEFTAVVGFRQDPDPALLDNQPLHIENPPPDARIDILFNAIGAKVLGQRQHRLSLQMEAKAEIRCAVAADAQEVVLLVDYLYESQLIGTARRKIAVTVSGATPPPPEEPDGGPARMGTPHPAAEVDLTVTIANIGGTLEWRFFAPAMRQKIDPIETRIDDTREFAAKLLLQLSEVPKGLLGERTLNNHAATIGDAIPQKFYDVLREVHTAVKRRPILLLHTDEMYVPWELARVDPPLSEAYGPSLLGAQAVVGRWLRHQKVPVPPPHDVGLTSMNVVASAYGRGTGQNQLPEALTEQNNLKSSLSDYGLGVIAFDATWPDMERLLNSKVTPGAAIHFAVHGSSEPEANDQVLLLADRAKLYPSTLAGARKEGEPPQFEFVFINACQVGTAGQYLGQAAGFPGALIRAGAKAFLAPLWNVHDGTARLIAEALYKETLQDGAPVAEFLSRQRAGYDPNETTTPLAYIFYGHPRMKIHRREIIP